MPEEHQRVRNQLLLSLKSTPCPAAQSVCIGAGWVWKGFLSTNLLGKRIFTAERPPLLQRRTDRAT
jgi:hypothetical protein